MLYTLTLVATCLAPTFAVPLTCHSQTQSNPIAKDFPFDVTGVINGTTAIVPIPYDVARDIIPLEYPILSAAYQQVFPQLGSGMYPAILEAVQDHDVGQLSLKIPDFTRMALKFPFVDRLKDGHSAFKFTPEQLVSATNLVALLGSTIYGKTEPATFSPPCDAYASNDPGETRLRGYSGIESLSPSAKPVGDTTFGTVAEIPYTLEAFVNVLNQPLFGSGVALCDDYITLFNTTVTMGQHAPVPVKGTLTLRPPLYRNDTTFGELYGYRMANAFIERNGLRCDSLKNTAKS